MFEICVKNSKIAHNYRVTNGYSVIRFVTDRTQFGFLKNKGQYKVDQLNARIITDIVVNDYRIYFSGF